MAKRRARRRESGDGSITQLANGKFRASIQLPPRPGEKRGRRASRICKSRAEAVIACRELLNKHATGIDAVESDLTMADWLASRHESYAASGVTRGTIETHLRATESHLAPHLGAVKVAGLTAQHIEGLLKAWNTPAGSGLALGRRSQEIAFRVLRKAVEDARAAGILAGDPLAIVKAPRSKRTKVDPFTAEEMTRILSAAIGGELEALWVLLFGCGLRFGEAAALSPRAVDLPAKQIRIERTGRYRGRGIDLKEPKTERSRRTISLPDRVVSALTLHQANALKAGRLGADFVFLNRAGRMLDINNIRARAWKQLLRKAGVAYRSLHQTRHTYATLTLMAGVPVPVVSAILGHSSPSTTLDLYSHYLPAYQSVATEAVDQLLRG